MLDCNAKDPSGRHEHDAPDRDQIDAWSTGVPLPPGAERNDTPPAKQARAGVLTAPSVEAVLGVALPLELAGDWHAQAAAFRMHRGGAMGEAGSGRMAPPSGWRRFTSSGSGSGFGLLALLGRLWRGPGQA